MQCYNILYGIPWQLRSDKPFIIKLLCELGGQKNYRVLNYLSCYTGRRRNSWFQQRRHLSVFCKTNSEIERGRKFRVAWTGYIHFPNLQHERNTLLFTSLVLFQKYSRSNICFVFNKSLKSLAPRVFTHLDRHCGLRSRELHSWDKDRAVLEDLVRKMDR
jgi:hypothetical protein